jgi:pilus assembly protein Flp/PilA
MAKFMTSAEMFLEGEEGATMIEYGLMLALIATVCFAAVALVGTALNTRFVSMNNEFAK